MQVISKEEDGGLRPTQFGRAIMGSTLDMNSAIRIYKDLENGMKSLCIDTEIHMLFLVGLFFCFTRTSLLLCIEYLGYTDQVIPGSEEHRLELLPQPLVQAEGA